MVVRHICKYSEKNINECDKNHYSSNHINTKCFCTYKKCKYDIIPHLYKNKIDYKDTIDYKDITINNIISLKQKLINYKIDLKGYHNIILNYIENTKNILNIYSLWKTEKELYLESVTKRSYQNKFEYFSNNEFELTDDLILYIPVFMSKLSCR